MVRVYLLSVEELGGECGAELARRAFDMLDGRRREKARHLKNAAARNLSIGAGLLLQLAAKEIVSLCAEGDPSHVLEFDREGRRQNGTAPPPLLQVSRILACLGEPLEIAYRGDPGGKPDFLDLRDPLGVPWHFSLSHSGNLVLCAVSDAEVGADIQERKPLKHFHVAERFFSEKEAEAIARMDGYGAREALFYRLWTRKEAYGKLTGGGIAAAVGQDLRGTAYGAGETGGVFWAEEISIMGYAAAICGYRNE